MEGNPNDTTAMENIEREHYGVLRAMGTLTGAKRGSLAFSSERGGIRAKE